jgi:biopolymer transport protein ExbB
MNSQFGLSHFFSQADGLAIALLCVLIIMSLCTWTLAFKRVGEHLKANKHYAALSASQQQGGLKAKDFSQVSIFSWAYHQQSVQSGDKNVPFDFLLDQTASQLDSGQIVLASIAATAPFVGLLGTVWGIYHALLAVAASGQASIEKIMGPVGETLLMTALGLVVALPAVMVYNLINRSNAKRLIQVQRVMQALPVQTNQTTRVV